MGLFVLTIVFALRLPGAYPGPRQLRGRARAGAPRGEYDAGTAPRPRRELEPRLRRRTPRMPVERAGAATRRRMAIGERLFMNNCAAMPRLRRARRQGLSQPGRRRLAARRHAGEDQGDDHPRPHRRDAADGRGGRHARRREERRQLRAEPVGQPARLGRAPAWARASSAPARPATAPTARATRRWARPTSTDKVWLHGCGRGSDHRDASTPARPTQMPAQAGPPDARRRSTCWPPTSGACRTSPPCAP